MDEQQPSTQCALDVVADGAIVTRAQGVEEQVVQLQPWKALVIHGVPSLSAIAVTFLLAPPDWAQYLLPLGGRQGGHGQ